MPDDSKLPGKTPWAGRRRPMTRRAGFKSNAPVRMRQSEVAGYQLEHNGFVSVSFELPVAGPGGRVAFGCWFLAPGDANVWLDPAPGSYGSIRHYQSPNWSKAGGQWATEELKVREVVLWIELESPGIVAVYGEASGLVIHDHFDDARPVLLKNMSEFTPEANIFDPEEVMPISIEIKEPRRKVPEIQVPIYLKSCNRCGRFLPVNVDDERAHLSFSSHCVAEHRRPCRHAGFGRIVDADNEGQVWEFEYGFQLECRFCKKFEVNAAHNPQRTAAQMKEDAARRRGLELLVDALYEGSPQLRYRRITGNELTEVVLARFSDRCFKCGVEFRQPKDMALDHTRPLMLLWPLDGSATALCAVHNSEKSGRPPVEYYSQDELVRLAAITGLSIEELNDPGPNLEAIDLLLDRLPWFFESFLKQPLLDRIHEGKLASDLVIAAVQRAIDRSDRSVNLPRERKRLGYG